MCLFAWRSMWCLINQPDLLLFSKMFSQHLFYLNSQYVPSSKEAKNHAIWSNKHKTAAPSSRLSHLISKKPLLVCKTKSTSASDCTFTHLLSLDRDFFNWFLHFFKRHINLQTRNQQQKKSSVVWSYPTTHSIGVKCVIHDTWLR